MSAENGLHEVSSGQNGIVESRVEAPTTMATDHSGSAQNDLSPEMTERQPSHHDALSVPGAQHDLIDPASRNYCCPVCKFATRYKTNLSTHMRRHLGDAGRIFKCPHCPYSTASNSDLNRHKKIRHLSQEDMANTYRCGLCSFSSMFQSNLRKHFRKKHAKRTQYQPALPVAFRNEGNTNSTSPSQIGALNVGMPGTIPAKEITMSTFISTRPALAGFSVKQEPIDVVSVQESLPEHSPLSYGGDRNVIDGGSISSSSVSSPPPELQRSTPDVLRNSSLMPVFPGSYNAIRRTPSPARSPVAIASTSPQENSSANYRYNRLDRVSPTTAASPVHSLLGKLRHKYYSTKNPSRSSRIALDLPRASPSSEHAENPSPSPGSGQLFECVHCSIYFAECAMFLMHRSLHNMENPLKCNLCGHHAADKYDFVAHYVNHR